MKSDKVVLRSHTIPATGLEEIESAKAGGSATTSSNASGSLLRSLLTGALKGFALYGASIYPAARYDVGEAEAAGLQRDSSHELSPSENRSLPGGPKYPAEDPDLLQWSHLCILWPW
jgi:hypothetical protein